MESKPQVIVVGLGAMGAAVLCQLAKRGIPALGIDRRPTPHAFGSSHGETRVTRCAIGEGDAYVPLALASHRIWRELEARTGQSLLVPCGCLIMAPAGGTTLHHGKPDFVERTLASARAAGIPHEELDDSEIAYRYPQLRNVEGSRACFEPGGGFVHPERCIEAELAAAQADGARVRWGEVSELAQKSGAASVTLDGETLEADHIVVAAGAWTGRLLRAPFNKLLTVTPQVLHWFAADGDAYAPSRFPTLIWMHGAGADDYFYSFPALAGACEIKAATEQYETDVDPDRLDRTVLPREPAAFYAIHLAGRLSGVRSEATRSVRCLYAVTPDSGFIIDRHPRMDRVTVISACSGHAFKHSAGIGEHVARSIESGRMDGFEAFGLGRFQI